MPDSLPTLLVRRTGWLLSLPLLLALAACGGGGERLHACTLEFRPALQVEPVDEREQALPDVQIVWRLHGGSPQTQTCALLPCGVDSRGGDDELSASKPGHGTASTRVRVEHDDCHPRTERWRPMLRRL